MAARVSELEDGLEQARSRAAKLEKDRNRLQLEMHEVITELEQVTCAYLLTYLLTYIQGRRPGQKSRGRASGQQNAVLYISGCIA